MTDETVQAAGCVLWRRSPVDGELEICLVHRPKYDDWSHPKGKLKHDEEPLAGALREVAEETGYTATPGTSLPASFYQANGRPKQVSYWAAEAADGHFTPNDEVDRILWLRPAPARHRLTQPRDRDLVDAVLGALRPAGGGAAKGHHPAPHRDPHRDPHPDPHRDPYRDLRQDPRQDLQRDPGPALHWDKRGRSDRRAP